MLESRKKLFEQLLWEHRGLSDAHATLQPVPSFVSCSCFSFLTGFFHAGFAIVQLSQPVSFV
jgi:hypothetical protein